VRASALFFCAAAFATSLTLGAPQAHATATQPHSELLPRSEPQASGEVHKAVPAPATQPDPKLLPRSEPKASGEAHEARARTSNQADPKLLPRSEPKASGEAHEARARTSNQADPKLLPRSEPKASGEAQSWVGRYCTPTGCSGGTSPSTFSQAASFGVACASIAFLARRRQA
jgi:hypothetical protein